VPSFEVGGTVLHRHRVTLHAVPLAAGLAGADAVAILTGHSVVDYSQVTASCPIVIDAVNVTGALAEHNGRVIRLGAPMPTA
jgi:UDP-N-acetyl-D-mannosaminuronate dehydrogenase